MVSNRKFLLPKHLTSKFNSFLKIKDVSNIKPRYRRKLRFFVEQVVLNKGLFIKQGFQLCSTTLAKEYDVTQPTMTSWLNQLVRLGYLDCVNDKWCPASRSKNGRGRSKAYRVADKYLIRYINNATGFTEMVRRDRKKNKLKKKFRRAAWKKAIGGKIKHTSWSEKLSVTGRYLGCQQSFVKDLAKYIPDYILNSPNIDNPIETEIHVWARAFDYVNKEQGYKATVIKKEKYITNITNRVIHATIETKTAVPFKLTSLVQKNKLNLGFDTQRQTIYCKKGSNKLGLYSSADDAATESMIYYYGIRRYKRFLLSNKENERLITVLQVLEVLTDKSEYKWNYYDFDLKKYIWPNTIVPMADRICSFYGACKIDLFETIDVFTINRLKWWNPDIFLEATMEV